MYVGSNTLCRNSKLLLIVVECYISQLGLTYKSFRGCIVEIYLKVQPWTYWPSRVVSTINSIEGSFFFSVFPHRLVGRGKEKPCPTVNMVCACSLHWVTRHVTNATGHRKKRQRLTRGRAYVLLFPNKSCKRVFFVSWSWLLSQFELIQEKGIIVSKLTVIFITVRCRKVPSTQIKFHTNGVFIFGIGVPQSSSELCRLPVRHTGVMEAYIFRKRY